MNDDNEIIKLSCIRCKKSEQGTFKELFGNLPTAIGIPTTCICGGDITLEMTGNYK